MKADIGLVIEGGGMRGAFSSGVLNAMLDAAMHFPYVIGMSSGAGCGLFYLSGQRDLNRRFYPAVAAAGAKAFGLRSWLSGKGLFNMHYIIDDIVHNMNVDLSAFFANPARYLIGATDADTSELVFWDKSDLKTAEELFERIAASASLPVLAPPVLINHRPYVDGGVVDSIPLMRAFADGCRKVVVIHTRPPAYVKSRQKLELIASLWLRRYPALRHAILTRHLRYNETVKKMYAMVEAGRVFVLQPKASSAGRYDVNQQSLERLYHEGHALVRDRHKALEAFVTT